MNKEELSEMLSKRGFVPATGKVHGLSSALLLGQMNGKPVVAIGGDADAKTQINAFQDAVHWHNLKGGTGTALFVLGRGALTDNVLPIVATLSHALGEKIRIDVEVDGKHHAGTHPMFLQPRDWLGLLELREGMHPPALALSLFKQAAIDSFRWYRPVTRNAKWSGRVDGLQVCEISHSGKRPLVMKIGKLGKKNDESLARRCFRKIAGKDEVTVKETDLEQAVEILRRIDAARATGALASCELEHRLEARVLRGATPVVVDGEWLLPAISDWPFQFPTLWSDSAQDRARYVDVLMAKGEVPWILELKVDSAGRGQHYRHAIGQAVLYREFVRRAKWLHPWFKKKNLDPTKCQAAIAFPAHPGDQRALLQLAAQFDVKVATLS